LRILSVIIDTVGGTGTACALLARALRESTGNKHTLSLLTIRDDSHAATLARNADGPFDFVSSLSGARVTSGWRRSTEVVNHVRRIRAFVKAHPCDLIITFSTYPNILVPFALPSMPLIATVHGNMTELLKGKRYRKPVEWMLARAFANRPVVCPTPGVSDDLRTYFPLVNAHVIPHGIDGDRVRQLANLISPSAVPTGSIVHVARLTPLKDQATLLRAYALARSNRPDVPPLVIIGDGELRGELTVLANELSLADNVHFVGHLDNPFPILATATMFVLTSLTEGFGLVLVEAMALGVPVISTDCPSGPADILGHGEFGLLAPPRDAQALSQLILRLLDPAERSHFASRARQRSNDYGAQAMANAYMKLIDELFSSRPAGQPNA